MNSDIISPANCPSRSRDACVTVNRRRGRITFTRAAVMRLGLKAGDCVAFRIAGDSITVGRAEQAHGFPLIYIRRPVDGGILGFYNRSAVRRLLLSAGINKDVVRIRMGGDSEHGIHLITRGLNHSNQ